MPHRQWPINMVPWPHLERVSRYSTLSTVQRVIVMTSLCLISLQNISWLGGVYAQQPGLFLFLLLISWLGLELAGSL